MSAHRSSPRSFDTGSGERGAVGACGVGRVIFVSARCGIITPLLSSVGVVLLASLSCFLIARSFSSNAVSSGVVGCLEKRRGRVGSPVSFVAM